MGVSILSDREKEVFLDLARGLTVKEIAVKIDRSTKTVEAHKFNLMNRLGIHSSVLLAHCAIGLGLIEPVVPYDPNDPKASHGAD